MDAMSFAGSTTSRAILIAIGIALPLPAAAQIVNIQGALAKPPEKDGVAAQLEAKLDWREGNNQLFEVGGGGSLLVRRGRLLGLAIARGEYGNAGEGIAIARKSFEHVRVRMTIDERWRWEAFAQHEYDQFRRLSVRALAGSGPAFQLVNTDRVAALAGVAYLFEFERLDHRSGVADRGRRDFASRGSLYVTGTEKLGAGASIVQTIYIQPRLDDFGDVRLLGELAVTSKLTKRIALTDGFVVAYDRTPPDGVRRYDTQLKVGLLVTL